MIASSDKQRESIENEQMKTIWRSALWAHNLIKLLKEFKSVKNS